MNTENSLKNTAIAVIGTGNMGGPMAINLTQAGFKVRAFDIASEKLIPLTKHGVVACADHADAISKAAIVLTMLPTGKEVADVYENHVFRKVDTTTLLIDSSTIDLKTALDMHTQASTSGYQMLDAPVSGGTAGAQSGKLTFMAGGAADALEAATPALQAMAGKIIHCGAKGMGQAAKMCNNLMLGIQMISVAEGFRLAQAVGLSEETLYNVALNSSGNCAALTAFNPIPGLLPNTPSSRDYQPGFSNDLMLKDMKLALNAAEQSSIPLDIAPLATRLYQTFSDSGNGDLDFSAIFKFHENESES